MMVSFNLIIWIGTNISTDLLYVLTLLRKEEKFQTPNYPRSVEEKIKTGFCNLLPPIDCVF